MVLGTSSWTCCRHTCVTCTASCAAAHCSSSPASCRARQVCAATASLISSPLVCVLKEFLPPCFLFAEIEVLAEKVVVTVYCGASSFFQETEHPKGGGTGGWKLNAALLPGQTRRKSTVYGFFSHTGMRKHHNYQIYEDSTGSWVT